MTNTLVAKENPLYQRLSKLPLACALTESETLDGEINAVLMEYNDCARQYGGVLPLLRPDDVTHIDVPAVQRDLIQAHRGNYFLENRIRGVQSFTDAVFEMHDRKRSGLKAWFPRRTDAEYNSQVAELSKMVENDFQISQAKEFYKPVSLGAFLTLIATSVGLASSAVDGFTSDKYMIYPLLGLMAGFVGSLAAQAPAAKGVDKYFRTKSQAELLDRKIKEYKF